MAIRWPWSKKTITPRIEKKVWGHYQILDSGYKCQVKRLTINPYHSISMQFHKHRMEIWTVVQGQITMTVDKRTRIMEVGHSVVVPIRTVHGCSTGVAPAVVIEIQIGSEIKESDIVRLTESR